MNRRWGWTLLGWVILLGMLVGTARPVRAQDPGGVVRAVFFYSPVCPHCHEVMTELFPQLRETYGDRLIIAEFDGTEPQGGALFQAAITRFEPELVGYPTLVVGEYILVGSQEIPMRFPELIDTYLAEGGVSWPDIPGVEAAVRDLEPSSSSSGITVWDRYTRDLAGNILATVVLVGLVATLVVVLAPRPWQTSLAARFAPWGMIALIVVGMIVASYLAYVETTQTEAICGPVGDCNTVQQSEFALLFGFLPVAVFGLLGYVAILISYAYGTWIRGPYAEYAPAVTFLLALFGLGFSIFLTFLEPFVIGATCAWCLTSAVSMALIVLLSAGPGWVAVKALLQQRRRSRSADR